MIKTSEQVLMDRDEYDSLERQLADTEFARKTAFEQNREAQKIIDNLDGELAEKDAEIHKAQTDVTYWWQFNTAASETISVITELEKQLAECKTELHIAKTTGLYGRYRAVCEENASLCEGLREYGQHDIDCSCYGDKDQHAANCANCDCGLAKLLESK